MSEAHPPSHPLGAESILHPHYLQAVIAPRLRVNASSPAVPGVDRFKLAREQVRRAQPLVGPPHPGLKGKAVHRFKSGLRRALYWYVEPSIDALRATNVALLDITESLTREVRKLEHEVESLSSDLDNALDSRRPTPERAAEPSA